MLAISLKKGFCHRKRKMKTFGNHKEFLIRIAKSLYYVEIPLTNCTSLPVTEVASEIFSKANRFSLNRLDIEKTAHFSRNGCASPCLLVLALLYLERLKKSNPKYLATISPTELFFISLMVGSKFLEDDGEEDEVSNTEWAELTGLPVNEINKAEKEFLDAINWEVFVSKEDFWNRLNLLEAKVGLKQGCKRGWFTYSELNALLHLIDLSTITQCLWNVTTACLLSYTASILAMIGSTLLVSQIPGLVLKNKVPSTNITTNDWTPISHLPLISDLRDPSNQIQDFNALSSLEITMPSNRTEPNFVNFCNPESAKIDTTLKEAVNMYLLHNLYLHLSPTGLLHFGQLLVENSKDKTSSGSFSQNFNIWFWSDYIRSFVLRNSLPDNFFSFNSF